MKPAAVRLFLQRLRSQLQAEQTPAKFAQRQAATMLDKN